MAAAARPLPQSDDSTSPRVTRMGRSRALRAPRLTTENFIEETVARERVLSQGAHKTSDAQESRLETILKAIAGVHDSVDERFALVQEAIDQVPDVGQVKEAVPDEVKRTVQQQVGDVVRHEVRSVVQHEVMNTVSEKVAAIVQQQITGAIQQQVTAIEQVTAIVEKQLSSVQHSSPNPSYADVARTSPGSRPSNLRTVSNQATLSTFTDTLYCTVDVSNVEEAERDNASASKSR
ncbi:hypothetical protein K431DRAFT_307402 [Polychaeton citri CBS 116435]|uniref:Uncharacterized protein n=1 Tax=Polychaeton citri CBS 116435 TaxID=1314669 RepID=A0A9P4Q1S3_9PEZI|nr:hypothetical protein K431DRAFT_307402 [Polychaeton citri CBS 116435]